MFLALLTASALQANAQGIKPTDYPLAPQRPITETICGHTLTDAFRWLENGHDPEVQGWATKENEFTESYLKANFADTQKIILERFKQLYLRNDDSAPVRYGKNLFFRRRYQGRDGYDYVMRPAGTTKDTVLLDSTKYSSQKHTLKDQAVSPDGRYVTYAVSTTNGDYGDLYMIDLTTMKHYNVLSGVRQSAVSWLKDESGFYVALDPVDKYPVAQEASTHGKTFFVTTKELLANPDAPLAYGRGKLVRENAGDPDYMMELGVDADNYVAIAQVSSYNDTKVHVWAKKYSPAAPFTDQITAEPEKSGFKKMFTFDSKSSNFKFGFSNNSIITVGRPDRATDENIYITSMDNTDPDKWRVLIPASPDYLHKDVVVVGPHLLVKVKAAGAEYLKQYDLNGKEIAIFRDSEFGETSIQRADPDRETVLLNATSPLDPGTAYEVDLKTGGRTVVKRSTVPFDPAPYQVDRVPFVSKDGAHADMIVLRRKDVKLDGTNKVFMDVYGGFGIGTFTGFNGLAIPLLEQGMVIAFPFVRGGDEYGQRWHMEALREKKQNTYNDVFAASEALIKLGYTAAGKISLHGGSNGGLTVSVCTTQRPDLFGPSIIAIPLTDMLRFHTAGAGKYWIGEYGNPEVPADFEFLIKYSPYQNIPVGVKLPPLMIQTGDFDDRVDPFHARKLTAKLQAIKTDTNPVLFQLQANAGHSGGGSLLANMEMWSWQMAFMWKWKDMSSARLEKSKEGVVQ
jgi:prolyl oligopeptidase